MGVYAPTECNTDDCKNPLPGQAGIHYCDPCIAVQVAEYGDEREAFDDFHKFADSCLTSSTSHERIMS